MMSREELLRSASSVEGMVDATFSERWPYLWHHLTQIRWEDGSPRQLSSVGLYPEPGCMRVMLKDPNVGLICWVAVDRMSDVWDILEAALRDPRHQWRADRQSKGQVAQRVDSPKVNGKVLDRVRKRR